MERVSKELTINGQGVKVHAISTGVVAVKQKFRESPYSGFLGLLSFLLDRTFTEWMPIWTWVIEHPEGIFLIDTGETSAINEKDFFKPAGWLLNWVNHSQFKFKITRKEEIDRQLVALGLSASDVDTVVLTHLHEDHVGGLKHFKDKKIVLNALEKAKPYGDLPQLRPKDIQLTGLELDESLGPFEHTKALTQQKDLHLIQTAGHTYGHSSVALKTDQGYLLFVGDVMYHQAQLAENKYSGGNVAPAKARASYAAIRTFAQAESVVVLPSHDAAAGERLIQLQFFK